LSGLGLKAKNVIGRLKNLFVSLCCILAISGLPSGAGWGQNVSDADSSAIPVNSRDAEPSTKPWYKHIDTHWGGRFKTAGFASRVTDDTLFEPVGTGTYYDAGANFRLTNETFFSDAVFTEIHYELLWFGGDSVRKQNELRDIFPNLPDNILFRGAPLNDDRRLMDLTDVIKEEDSWFLAQRLDRLYLALRGEKGSLRIGRQAITWGDGFVFNPMDLFNPFPPTAIDRDYKAGDDMINGQYPLGQLGDLQLLYVARRNPDNDNVESDQASLAGKLHFALGTNEFDVLISKHFEDNVIGAGSRGYLGNTAWRLDATWTLLDDGDDYLSLVANMDYSWVWFKNNFYGFIEYYYNGLGKDDYADALLDPDVNERLARGELFVLGQNYISGHIQVELHPLFKLTLTAINNIEDPSGILQPYAVWDVTQNLQMTAGLNFYYGDRGTEFGGFKLPGLDLRNKAPDNAYLWFNYYF
jgi:hypothetical protein